ncbi:Acid-sensing ion channel 4-A-like 1, partial [Homarus americanus]
LLFTYINKSTRASYLDRLSPPPQNVTVSQLVLWFNQSTTCHGPPHVARNRGNGFSVLWAIATTILTASLGFASVEYFISFFHRDVRSQTTAMAAQIGGLQLPTVVICNRAYFSRAKLEAYEINRNTTSYLMLVAGTPSLARLGLLDTPEGRQMLADAHQDLQRILRHNNMTMSELITAVSYTCEDLVHKCGQGAMEEDQEKCCRKFTPVSTNSGLCFSRVAGASDRQAIVGEYMGLVFYMKLRKDDIPVVTPSILQVSRLVKSGIQVTVTSNLTYLGMVVTGQGTILTPGSLTSIQISLTKINSQGLKTLLDIKEPECVPSYHLDYHKDRSSFLATTINCFDGALTRCFRRVCGCRFYSEDQGEGLMEKMCTPQEVIKCYNQLIAQVGKLSQVPTFSNLDVSDDQDKLTKANRSYRKCKPVCDELSYSYTASTNPIRATLLDELNNNFLVDNESTLSAVTVYYPHLAYTCVKFWREDIGQLIGDLGGYMGLFLGCSIISVLEFVTFLVALVCLMCWRLYLRCLSPQPTVVTPLPAQAQLTSQDYPTEWSITHSTKWSITHY